MMTLKMIPTSGQVSKLPTSSTAIAIPPPKFLIEIRSNGQLLAEGREIEPAEISALVKSRDPANLAVTIAGSDDASMQHLMRAVDAVRLGGATQIGLAAKQVSR